MFLGSLSRHNKDLEQWTLEPSPHHSSRVLESVIALRQTCVTALFYLEDSRRIHPQSLRACQPKDLKGRGWRSAWGRERERKSTCTWQRKRERKRFGSSFYMFFFLHLSLPYANWAYPGVLFVLPEVFTLVLGPSFVLFLWAFPSLSFSHRHFGLLVPVLPT